MTDDVGRLDERLEQFVKLVDQRFSYHEEQDDTRFADLRAEIKADFKAFETLMRSALDNVLKVNEAEGRVMAAKMETQKVAAEARADLLDSKNVPFRVALGILGGALLTALAGLLLSSILATHPVKFTPEPAPAHSSREAKEH